jgi:hypothetical protein
MRAQPAALITLDRRRGDRARINPIPAATRVGGALPASTL